MFLVDGRFAKEHKDITLIPSLKYISISSPTIPQSISNFLSFAFILIQFNENCPEQNYWKYAHECILLLLPCLRTRIISQRRVGMNLSQLLIGSWRGSSRHNRTLLLPIPSAPSPSSFSSFRGRDRSGH